MSATALSPLLPRIPEPHARGFLRPVRLIRIADRIDPAWACQVLRARDAGITPERTDDHVAYDIPVEPHEVGPLVGEPRLEVLLTCDGVLCLALPLAVDHDLDDLARILPQIRGDTSLAALYDDHLRVLRDRLAPACSGPRQSQDLGWFWITSARVRPGSDFLRAYRTQIVPLCAFDDKARTLRLVDGDEAQIALTDDGAFVLAAEDAPIVRRVLSSAVLARLLRDEHAQLTQALGIDHETRRGIASDAISKAFAIPKLDSEVRRLRELAGQRRQKAHDRHARIRIEVLLWILVVLSLLILAQMLLER